MLCTPTVPLEQISSPNTSLKKAAFLITLSGPNYLWAALGYIKGKKPDHNSPTGEVPYGPLNCTLCPRMDYSFFESPRIFPTADELQTQPGKPGTGPVGGQSKGFPWLYPVNEEFP